VPVPVLIPVVIALAGRMILRRVAPSALKRFGDFVRKATQKEIKAAGTIPRATLRQLESQARILRDKSITSVTRGQGSTARHGETLSLRGAPVQHPKVSKGTDRYSPAQTRKVKEKLEEIEGRYEVGRVNLGAVNKETLKKEFVKQSEEAEAIQNLQLLRPNPDVMRVIRRTDNPNPRHPEHTGKYFKRDPETGKVDVAAGIARMKLEQTIGKEPKQLTNVRKPTTLRSEKIKKTHARGGPVGYTERWKTGRKG